MMSTYARYLAVIPAYNESQTLGGRSARRHAPAFDVLVVDDGSTDDTAAIAEAAGASVVRHPFNLGIGGAVQAGFQYAHEHGYDYMVQVDGDGQHEPRRDRQLIDAIAGPAVDMVCGSRFLTDDRLPAPISRRTGIHLFAFLLSRIVGQRVTDPTSGFRLYNRRAIELFARDYPHDYPEVEAVLMLHSPPPAMREVPVRMFQRGGGVSSITLRQVGLLHDQGAARALRRAGAAAPVPEPGDARRVAPRTTGSDGQRIQVVAIVASGPAAARLLELVRRRRLLERYALLWLFSAVVLLGAGDLARAAGEHRQAIGVAYAPNALFFVAFGFVLVLLLHFSLAVSRLADQSKVLARAAFERRAGSADPEGRAQPRLPAAGRDRRETYARELARRAAVDPARPRAGELRQPRGRGDGFWSELGRVVRLPLSPRARPAWAWAELVAVPAAAARRASTCCTRPPTSARSAAPSRAC